MNANYVKLLCSLVCLAAPLALCGCSKSIISVSHDGSTITRIEMKQNGATAKNQSAVFEVCKGFLLSEKQVRDFFVHATFIKDTDPANRYGILPCYSAGTAIINGEPHEWIIRAGGIGEFSSTNSKFVKICGKDCCAKVTGIC